MRQYHSSRTVQRKSVQCFQCDGTADECDKRRLGDTPQQSKADMGPFPEGYCLIVEYRDVLVVVMSFKKGSLSDYSTFR